MKRDIKYREINRTERGKIERSRRNRDAMTVWIARWNAPARGALRFLARARKLSWHGEFRGSRHETSRNVRVEASWERFHLRTRENRIIPDPLESQKTVINNSELWRPTNYHGSKRQLCHPNIKASCFTRNAVFFAWQTHVCMRYVSVIKASSVLEIASFISLCFNGFLTLKSHQGRKFSATLLFLNKKLGKKYSISSGIMSVR